MSFKCPQATPMFQNLLMLVKRTLFLPRVPLSKQIPVLYVLIHHNQPGVEYG